MFFLSTDLVLCTLLITKYSGANVLMVFLQYAALHQIYHRVPELAGSLSRRSSSVDKLCKEAEANGGAGTGLRSIALNSPNLSVSKSSLGKGEVPTIMHDKADWPALLLTFYPQCVLC